MSNIRKFRLVLYKILGVLNEMEIHLEGYESAGCYAASPPLGIEFLPLPAVEEELRQAECIAACRTKLLKNLDTLAGLEMEMFAADPAPCEDAFLPQAGRPGGELSLAADSEENPQ